MYLSELDIVYWITVCINVFSIQGAVHNWKRDTKGLKCRRIFTVVMLFAISFIIKFYQVRG